MCIIALTKRGNKEITLAQFQRMNSSNPHGIGIMYRTNMVPHWNYKFVHIKKFLSQTQVADSFEYYKKLLLDDNVDDICIHFRMSTHWVINVANTHPFPYTSQDVLNDWYFVHNGILPWEDKEGLKSDTALLSDLLMQVNEPLTNPVLMKMIMSTKSWSKFVFMDSNSTKTIWDFIEDEWNLYSNSWYKPYEHSYSSTRKAIDDYYSLMSENEVLV